MEHRTGPGIAADAGPTVKGKNNSPTKSPSRTRSDSRANTYVAAVQAARVPPSSNLAPTAAPNSLSKAAHNNIKMSDSGESFYSCSSGTSDPFADRHAVSDPAASPQPKGTPAGSGRSSSVANNEGSSGAQLRQENYDGGDFHRDSWFDQFVEESEDGDWEEVEDLEDEGSDEQSGSGEESDIETQSVGSEKENVVERGDLGEQGAHAAEMSTEDALRARLGCPRLPPRSPAANTVHPQHHFLSGIQRNLWCTTCHGQCPKCHTNCCFLDEAKMELESNRLTSEQEDDLMDIVEEVMNCKGVGDDSTSFRHCQECDRWFCQACVSVCDHFLCKAIQCTSCKPNPFEPCDWHD